MTDSVRAGVHRHWGIIPDSEPVRLYGGEESASYRIGSKVVRIGPTWRSSDELEWSYGVAARSAVVVPEVTAPVPTAHGAYTIRLDERPVSVWPFADGGWGDRTDDGQRLQAAELLARLHRRFGELEVTPRPVHGSMERGPAATAPEMADPELDKWLAEFAVRRSARHPLHADFYRGNVLVRAGRITALVDWDDVMIGPPEQELAWAAWEWGGCLDTLDLEPAMRFIDRYADAGGTADRIDVEELAQLARGRIRMDVDYSVTAGDWGTSNDPEDVAYRANQLEAFDALRP